MEDPPSAEGNGLLNDTFVGREQELAELVALLTPAGGKSQSILLEGAAGIGKSRLLSEFQTHARTEGVRVLQSSCYQLPEAEPYSPVRQILDQLHPSGRTSGETLRDLTGDVGGLHEWAQLSEDVRGRRAHFLRSLARVILDATAGEPSLLSIDDIQWADVGTLLVLDSLLDLSRTGLHIAYTLRSHEVIEGESRNLLARIRQRSRILTVHGLGVDDVGRLASAIADVRRVTDVDVRALADFTQGNPLLLRELLTHWRESAVLNRYSIRQLITQSRTPDNLTHFVDLHVQELPAEALPALKAGATLGTEFEAASIARIIDASEASVSEQLQLAADKAILRSTGLAGRARFSFAHPLIAKRIYETLPSRDRQALHRKIARLGSLRNIALDAGNLARHYALGYGASSGGEGLGYCRAAAENAERLLAFEMAAHFWELGLLCLRPQSGRQRAGLLRRRGWALWAAGLWSQAAEEWTEAVDLFASAGEGAYEAELALALGDMHRWRLELDDAEKWLARGVSTGRATQHYLGRALAQLGGIRRLRGEPDASELLDEADRLIQVPAFDPVAAYWLSFGRRVGGEHSKAYDVARTGLREAQRQRLPAAAALLAASLITYDLCGLDSRSARAHSRLAKRMPVVGDTTAFINQHVGDALILEYSGRWDLVIELCERWMAGVRLSSKFQYATARMYWAEAKMELGDLISAEGVMRRALPELAAMQSVASLHLARVKVRMGAENDAVSIARESLPSLVKNPRTTAAAGRAVLGDVASSVQEPGLWRTCYRLLELEPSPVVMAYSPVSVQRVLGRLASRLGLWSEAFAHFDTAVRQLAQGKAYWELTQSYRDYAEMRRARGRRGDANKAAALDLKAEALLKDAGVIGAARTREHVLPENGNRFGLTKREIEVLELVASGRRNQEIAGVLSVTKGTVNRHVENIFTKMDAHNRTEAVMRGVEEGLVISNSDKVKRL